MAYVKDTGIGRGGGVASISCAFGSAVAAGNALIGAVAGWRNPAWNLGSFSDGTNTWTVAVTSGLDFTGLHRTSIAYALNIASGTPTVTISAAAGSDNYMSGCVMEHSGLELSGALDQTISAATGSLGLTSTGTGTSGTTTQNDELIVCAFGLSGMNGASCNWGTPTTGYTRRAFENDASNYQGFCFGDKTVSATGAQTAAVTHSAGNSNNAAGVGALATFKLAAGGGTAYFSTVSGALAPSGSMQKQTRRGLSAAVATAGALLRQSRKGLAATLSTAGVLLKRPAKFFTGSLTPSGTLTAIKTALRAITGSLALSGVLLRQSRKSLAATLSTAGVLLTRPAKFFTGTVTPSGAFSAIKTALLSIAGTLATSAALLKQSRTVLSAALTTAGTVSKQSAKSFAGIVTSSGGLSAIKTALLSIAGTLATSGSLLKQSRTVLSATLTTAGAISKQTTQSVAGAVSLAGSVSGLLSGLLVTVIRFLFARGAVSTFGEARGQVSRIDSITGSF